MPLFQIRNNEDAIMNDSQEEEVMKETIRLVSNLIMISVKTYQLLTDINIKLRGDRQQYDNQ